MGSLQTSDYKQIIRHLAEGIDPITGEVLEGSGPLNSPVVIRALYSLLAELEAPKAKPKSAKSAPENFGKPWTDTDRTYLQQSYLGGVSEADLAETLKRTKGGISSELVRLGLKEATAANGMRSPPQEGYNLDIDTSEMSAN